MELVQNPGSEDDRFSTYVDCPEEGCIYTLESGVLMQYARLADGTWETTGAEVDWKSGMQEHEHPRFRRIEALLKIGGVARSSEREVVVYVPREGHSATTGIAPASGIVGVPEPGAERVLIYYEGAIRGQLGMQRLADRVNQAYGRLISRYPTVAFRVVAREALVAVGTFDPDSGEIALTGPESERDLAPWLGTEQVDRAELRRSGR